MTSIVLATKSAKTTSVWSPVAIQSSHAVPAKVICVSRPTAKKILVLQAVCCNVPVTNSAAPPMASVEMFVTKPPKPNVVPMKNVWMALVNATPVPDATVPQAVFVWVVSVLQTAVLLAMSANMDVFVTLRSAAVWTTPVSI